MAYVPQYRYDVFISYAHRDEKPAPGWVSAFKAKLEAELGQELGEDPEIWFDLERLKEGFVLQETIRYDLSRTALFLRLESPSCLQSPYCPKELEWFRNPQLPLDPLEIEHRSRVIPLVIRVQCHVHDPNVIEGAFHDKDGLPLDSEGLEIRGHDGGVESIAFAPLGNRLAAGLNDGAVNMFDLRRPNVSPQVFPGDQSTVYSVSIAPDGDYLAASGDGTVRVWDLDKPKNRPRILSGHQGPVFSVAFAPDGDRLASAGDDKDIRIWDLHQPNAPPDTLSGHQDVVWSVAFAPDGNHLASASADGTVRLWPLWSAAGDELCKRAWRNLSKEEWKFYIGEYIPYERTCPNLPPGVGAPGAPK